MRRYKKIVGFFGQNLAKNYLIKNGYIIIDENKKLGFPELDIVAKKEKEVIFVEVKTRVFNNTGLADEALKKSQVKTLKKAICIYCYKNKISLENSRLDFISVDINKKKMSAKIKHYKNIF